MKSPKVVTALVIAAAVALLAGASSSSRAPSSTTSTIVWLTDHPMRPHIELRNGFLVVYVPGWIEDLGRVVWLLEAAEKIAERVQAEVGEAAPTVG